MCPYDTGYAEDEVTNLLLLFPSPAVSYGYFSLDMKRKIGIATTRKVECGNFLCGLHAWRGGDLYA